MILYTEKQLQTAYYKFIKKLPVIVPMPSLQEFRNKAIAIWFQMVELAWKSKYYEHEEDPSGTKMTEFEELGDQLKGWSHKKL